jgi:hypothetical protein
MPLKHINENFKLMFGRDLDPDELEARTMLSPPSDRAELIRQVGNALDQDGISLDKRSRLLGLKSRIGSLHERMLRVYR